MKKIAVIAGLVGALTMLPTPAHASQGFTIMASADGTKAEFYYLTSAATSSNVASGWVGGDRVGYGCAYAFLRSGRTIVGRVTFMRIEYAMINDKYMDEGARYYNGKRYTGHHHQLNDCPEPSEAYVDTTDPIGPVPVVTFTDTATGVALDVRDFASVEQSGDGTRWEFQVVAAGPRRVRIVGYQSGEPVLAIYYDRLSTDVTLSSNA